MRLVVDENLPYVREFFGRHAELQLMPGTAITARDLEGADGLLVRSVTRVDAALLQNNTSLRFVGTATIGTDHVDQSCLAERGIHFASAPGCNADSVVDYVISSLLWLVAEQGLQLRDQCIGIVGVGQVGGRLARRLQAYGCQLLLNDPPRAVAGDTGLVDLDALLEAADIICLHTPLTRAGESSQPTFHLFDEGVLSRLAGKVLLNAGRGAVVDQQALLRLLQQGQAPALLLDVFEGEPLLDASLIDQCLLATPHIAGYSLEGKSRGTEMLYQAWCAFTGQTVCQSLPQLLPAVAIDQLHLDVACSPEEACRRVAHLCYQPLMDGWRLRQALKHSKDSAAVYQQLRKDYPVRREFASLPVKAASEQQASALRALGFAVTNEW
ncbi:4-phosphoerythronate dehydrogenase [Marinospirillum alkaliphilum]|uniref:Erythronate-4-phosphate dehydrogenase n=1 Tax=Marinospirillum alkaliphilum DSM 21637 TaxID=1122209 RepID=A0A1K1YPQ8_9GAMM|nr:4-phosphoerythronate dehydrogenase [Marinospirillum alkaliphilum]SFX63419.1 erythronate-4-phosphate dehydrogenase [Marinospirillum alkaliphilum DSM 21637]